MRSVRLPSTNFGARRLNAPSSSLQNLFICLLKAMKAFWSPSEIPAPSSLCRLIVRWFPSSANAIVLRSRAASSNVEPLIPISEATSELSWNNQ